MIRAAAFALVSFVPAALLACPICESHQAGDGAFWWALGSMILLPFPVVGLVAYVIKRGAAEEGQFHSEEEV